MEEREWKLFHNGLDISDRQMFDEMLFGLPEKHTITRIMNYDMTTVLER
jgi:hypothetical protein